MKTREILSIVALAALGLCLLCGLAKMAMKGPKAKQSCDHACSLLVFMAVVLVGVSQLLGENKDGYKNMPPVSDCRDMKQMKTLTNSGEQTTVAPPLKCNSSGITGNCTQIPSSAAIVDQCGKCVKGTNCPTLDVNSKDYSCFTAPGGYKGGITCGDGIDNVNFTTAN